VCLVLTASVPCALFTRGSAVLQVSLSIELNDSQVEEFQQMIPVQLALPPWNYTDSVDKGITVLIMIPTDVPGGVLKINPTR